MDVQHIAIPTSLAKRNDSPHRFWIETAKQALAVLRPCWAVDIVAEDGELQVRVMRYSVPVEQSTFEHLIEIEEIQFPCVVLNILCLTPQAWLAAHLRIARAEFKAKTRHA